MNCAVKLKKANEHKAILCENLVLSCRMMVKKLLFSLLAILLWAVLLMRIGDKPRMGKLMLYTTSPLQAGKGFDNAKKFKAGVWGSLSIGYDTLGVPFIFAKSDTALDFGMGYVHARDRMFQVEMIRRTVSGRLSEVAGPKALSLDLFWRKFGFERKAKQWFEEVKQLYPEQAARLEAYAEGYNHYLSTMPYQELPAEFHLLDMAPGQMHPGDCYLLIRYMDFMLNYAENRLKHSELQSLIGDSLYQFYFPGITKDAFPMYQGLAPTPETWQSLLNTHSPHTQARATGLFPHAKTEQDAASSLGSNNWVVAGSKSTSGFPILCNDTHLGITLPPVWYEVHRKSNSGKVHGLSIPGAPFIISGFNDSVAWGITNATWDLVQFYALETRGANQYVLDGKTVEYQSRYDTIEVRGEKPQYCHFKESAFGILDTFDGKWLAVDWVGMRNSHEEIAFANLMKATNLGEMKSALQHFHQPAQNFVLADASGNIGMMTCGLASLPSKPIRGIIQAKNSSDKIPFIPLQSIIQQTNPSVGYLASANQHQVKGPLADLISLRYESPARGRRIHQLLESKPQLSPKDMMHLQGDIVDSEWNILKAPLLRALPTALQEKLKDWDGRCDTNSVAATLFYAFKLNLPRVVGQLLHPQTTYYPQDVHLFHLLEKQKSLPIAKGRISTDSLIRLTWDSAKAELAQKLGDQLNTWKYGRYHRFVVNHIAKLAPFSLPEVPANGNNRTVNVSSRMPASHGASMRTIIALSPKGPKAWMLVSGGQSGRINSRHYADQVDDYHAVRYHEVRYPDEFNPKVYSTTIQFQ